MSEQSKMEINDQNELILVESRTMRDEHVFKVEAMDKVKLVQYLTPDMEVTVEMAANYYEVNIETIKQVIKRHRSEFNDYNETRVLKGKKLQEFKGQVHNVPELKNAPSLTLINSRGLLRIGMLLTQSDIAKSIRHVLLNVYEASTKDQIAWATEREISRRERRQLTDAIKDFYLAISNSGFEYRNFTDLVYRVVFDKTAKQLKEEMELDKNDNLRDELDTTQLRKVVNAEKAVCALIMVGKNYQEIKDEMLKFKERFQ